LIKSKGRLDPCTSGFIKDPHAVGNLQTEEGVSQLALVTIRACRANAYSSVTLTGGTGKCCHGLIHVSGLYLFHGTEKVLKKIAHTREDELTIIQK